MQRLWALGAATCAVIVASVLLHRDVEAPATVSRVAATSAHEHAPSRGAPPAMDVATPSASAVPADDLPDVSDDLRPADDHPAAQRPHALTRARLRRAQREARLRAKRRGTSPRMLLDADGIAMPLDVWVQGERFDTATPVETSELAEPLGGSRGSVSFWFQPRWSAGSQDDASFLEIADGFIRVVKNVDFLRFEFIDANGVEHGLGATIADWQPGEWHQIAGSWDDGSVALYFDGELVRQAAIDMPIVLPDGPRMRLGSDFPEFRPIAAGMVGGVRVTARPLSADEVRRRFVGAFG